MDFPPSEPREYARSEAFPDVMNDPAYATNVNADGREKGFEEPDTCRICRGEGSDEDQLFYPCKCSGSIKFVHQSCLVEWLSHSQKKYCELCKTPFRFTKLYDPNMPRDLPPPLFLRQLAIHSFYTVVTWLRFVLVAFVWLGWLPWSMRAIWRALFWLADGRWPGGSSLQLGKHDNGTTLAETVVSATSSAISTGATSMVTDSPSVKSPMSSLFTFSTDEPVMLTLIKKGFSTLFPVSSSSAGLATSNVTTSSYKQRHPSWLSDVKVLNTLTPSPTINNIIIDTLEGQLITLLVVISFILVFLIREWVVQQQPLANIADGEREVAVQLVANNRPNQEAQPQPEPEPVLQPEEDFHHEEIDQHAERASDHEQEEELLHPMGGRFFQDGTLPGLGDTTAQGSSTSAPTTHPISGDHGVLPGQFTDQSRVDQVWDTFRDIWARGGGNPDQIRQIIHEEGREEELDWIVALTARLQRNRSSQSSNGPIHVDVRLPDITSLQRMAAGDAEDGSSASIEIPQTPYETQSHPDRAADNGAFEGIERPIGPRFGEGSGTGSPQHAFTFNFRETRPTMPEAVDNGEAARLDNELAFNEELPGTAHHRVLVDTPAANGAAPESSENQQQSSQRQQNLPRTPKSIVDQVLDWFWADIAPEELGPERPQQDDEHIVEDPALEAPFIPVHNNGRLADEGAMEDEDDAAGEAGMDANDVDAIEEADDLEGILELIGMQGPIFGLLQNGVFSALLISLTVALGIWLPYLWGKIALVLLANPIELIFGVPMTAVSVVADITLDTLVGSLGYVLYMVSIMCKLVLGPIASLAPVGDLVPRTKSITSASLSLIDASSNRLSKVANAFLIFHESDVPMFSVISHQALKIHQARIVGFFQAIFAVGKFVLHDFPLRIISLKLDDVLSLGNVSAIDFGGILGQAREQVYEFVHHPYASLNGAVGWVKAGLLKGPVFDLTNSYYDLALWSSKDRAIAIIMGYVLASVVGLMYLRITGLLSGAGHGQRIEGLVADILHQAGGVMKVILIIGIEMIVFPLYCGSLLDIALLPLFQDATIASRIEFSSTSPLTSLFVHWFIGTCYMFHFALFVSMCRKIMRSGVLYFIRDPDDPTFHPVRDVLERNITTQLRKIAFSAMVYGALVIVCLGGVVWGIFYAFDGVLPVHWSASAPVLEFPVDLLFYNFVMPLAIKSIKPSDGLHNLYDWWFHRCARFLRLTNFFFGDRQPDEEGHHVRRTWWDVLCGKKGDPQDPVTSEEQQAGLGVFFLRDGRFVRAPSSDQVRIPKGCQVFLEVTEDNKRVDGAPDSDGGLHGSNSDMFTKVYIPPFFRIRIAAFILSIWAFAAVTGVGITVLPLVTGRKILSSYFSNKIQLNDIYCFSTGMCVVGVVAYVLFHCRTGFAAAKDNLQPYLRSPRKACLGVLEAVLSTLRLLYVFAAFSVIFPSLLALVLELYVLIPLHTYFGSSQAHVIHFVQDWTLGVLYVQMAVKFMLWNSTTRPAAALNRIFHDNWLKPDARLATRALVLPFTLAVMVAVVVPLALGFLVNSTVYASSSDMQWKVYRYAYPFTFFTSATVWFTYMVRRQVDIWRVNVRDDVYLIGERLHNLSDRRAKDSPSRRVGTS